MACLSKNVFFIVLATLFWLPGCSSNHFIDYDLDNPEWVLEEQSALLNVPNWSEMDTALIYQDCVDIQATNITSIILLAVCSHELLSRDDLDESQQSFALLQYKNALALILSPLLESQGILELDSVGVRVSLSPPILAHERVFLNSKIISLDERLTFKTFGELGISGIIARQNTLASSDQFYPREGIFRPITFTLDSFEQTDKGWQLSIASHQLNEPKNTFLGERSYPLSYSPGAAYMMLLELADIDELSWIGLVRPTEAESRRGVFSVEEMSPQKTPILMIHGLNSDPLIWRNLTLAILNDPELHERYQIWHAFYPSGPPPFFNAMILRDKLAQILELLPSIEQQGEFVVVGHSMGGIIANTMVTDSEYVLWDATFKERPEQLIKDGREQKIKDIFVFSPQFANNTTFFINTPHRGSSTANSLIGQIGAALVALPESFLGLFRRFINKIGSNNITSEMLPFLEDYGPNSVQVLRPGHPLVEKLNTLPIEGEVYSIIGSQGKTDCESPVTCVDVSDGVVPYTSAHIDQSADEIVVLSGHDSYQNENAINFILKKLKSK